jgi:hypothetical protein
MGYYRKLLKDRKRWELKGSPALPFNLPAGRGG